MPLLRVPLTPASLAARRRNAQKSTGPRTARGKAQVRLHALKHGRRSARFSAYVAERLHLDPRAMLRLPAMGAGPVLNVLMEGWLGREFGPESPELLQFVRCRAASKRREEIEFIERTLDRYAAVARLFRGVPGVSAGVAGALGEPETPRTPGMAATSTARLEVPAPIAAKLEKVARRLTARLGVLRRAEARAESGAKSRKRDKQTWEVTWNQSDKKSTFGLTGQ